ncbi:MAG TPA: alpha-1,4-glucan--maltose-1-phosphate maltosyltransferase [Chthoniobacterales bacterium]|nr:alpha-1,4-glucan--maltose-1-phosphate maltosyltransferase [Chthoniobacterales bacterium]
MNTLEESKERPPTVTIESIDPCIDCCRYPVKRVTGQELRVAADVFKDGHDVVAAVLKWRVQGTAAWMETPMIQGENDRWSAVCHFTLNTNYEFTIEAWGDEFRSWSQEFQKKFAAGTTDLTTETEEGAILLEHAASRATRKADQERLTAFAAELRASQPAAAAEIAKNPELLGLMSAYPDRSLSTEAKPYLPVVVDRPEALFAAWYEFFPRSAEGEATGSKFRDCLPRVDDAKAMGFDVIYFPPIHPIGFTKRKGKNNSVNCEPGDPGVPYAIGSKYGGHLAVEPELGTLDDFDWLVQEIRSRGMEVALDFAINCSPDHPYVGEHPEWFFHRPDGTIKYAENPPKKYEDVYPLNFYNENWRALWEEMKRIILFWAGHNVRIFRVDNPHTKPTAFWEWLIAEIRAQYPDVIFLSEAFTRPKMMKALAKAGFTQSYTYFTWRNTKAELTEYLTELCMSEMKYYFRGNFFTNTPDILPFFLQTGGRPAFLIRAFLAATLSTVYGIYSGFELCENVAVPDREEYLNSEKYQFKERDWNAPGNIKDYITQLNQIRRENRALHLYENLRFHTVENDQILFYSKATPGLDNILLFFVTVDPYHSQSAFAYVPLEDFGLGENESFQVEDLLTGERFGWQGRRNFVLLNPISRPAHLFRVRRPIGRDGAEIIFG